MIKNFFEIAKREMNIIAEDHSILLTVIGAPLLYFFLLGLIYINKSEEKVKFGVLDYGNTQLSRMFVRYLDATQNLEVAEKFSDYSEAVESVNRFEIFGFILLPSDFEKKLRGGESADVSLYLNTTRFLPSNDLYKAVSTVALTISAGIRLKYFQAQGLPPEGAMEKVLPLRPAIHNLFNPANTYGDFLLPALFLLILHQTLLIGLGESVTLENQRGTLKEIYEKSGKNWLRVLHAKSIYYIGLYIAYAIITYSVIFPIFGIEIAGNYFLLMILTFVFIMAIIYITFLIGSFFTKQIVIMETLAFTSYPIFLVSGFSWPLDSLPAGLQYVANLTPITPFYSAFTRIVEMGASWQQVAPQIIHLSVLTLVYLFLSLWRFRVKGKKIGNN